MRVPSHPAHVTLTVPHCSFHPLREHEGDVLCPLDLVAALPAESTGRLRSKEVTEGTTVTFHCELSKEAPMSDELGPCEPGTE